MFIIGEVLDDDCEDDGDDDDVDDVETVVVVTVVDVDADVVVVDVGGTDDSFLAALFT